MHVTDWIDCIERWAPSRSTEKNYIYLKNRSIRFHLASEKRGIPIGNSPSLATALELKLSGLSSSMLAVII